MTLLVQIVDLVHRPYTPSLEEFQRWVNSAVITPVASSEVNICLIDKDKSQELNHRFRKKMAPTNILSFEYPNIGTLASELLGDLIICSELVEEEAKQQNKSLEAHFAHLTIHGMLHLQNYDHEIKEEAEQMERLEIQIMNQLGYPNP